jgi:hypothetical protein
VWRKWGGTVAVAVAGDVVGGKESDEVAEKRVMRLRKRE